MKQNILDTTAMVLELNKAGVYIELNKNDTAEEKYNRIIHLYDLFILSPPWQFQEETAWLVYSQRKYRNQSWQKAWKP